MHRRMRDMTAQLKPAAVQMLLGGLQQCTVCSRRIHHGSRSLSMATELEHLEPVISHLQRFLCAQCLATIPWIRDVHCATCGRAVSCPDCTRRRSPQLALNRASVQYNEQMKQWLANYKYRGDEKLQPILSTMLNFAYSQLLYDIRDTMKPEGLKDTEWTEVRNDSGLIRDNRPSEKASVVDQYVTPQTTRWELCALRKNHRAMPVSKGAGRAAWMRRALDRVRRTQRPTTPFQPIVTSVPISESRIQERGFNQAERLAEDLAAAHRLPYVPLLSRIRHTDRQSHKSRRSRIVDLQGVFSVTSDALEFLDGAASDYDAILIVDDVYTTGSTLHECARVIQTVTPLPVYSVTWAR